MFFPPLVAACIWAAAAATSTTPMFAGIHADASIAPRTAQALMEIDDLSSQCFTDVVATVKSCAHLMLGEDALTRLSLGLFDCQLAHDGRAPWPCPQSSPRACTAAMPVDVYQQYLVVAGKVTAVCLHYQQLAWRKAADVSVDRLLTAAATSAEQLQLIQRQQHELGAAQNTLLETVDAAADELGDQMTQALLQQQTLLRQQDAALANQQTMLSRTLNITAAVDRLFSYAEQILVIETAVLQQFLDLQTVFYFIGVTALAFFLTASRRAQRARFWVFAWLAVGVVVELVGTRYSVAAPGSGTPPIRRYTWPIRRCFLAMAALALTWSIVTFKDYAHLSYDALQRLEAAYRDTLEKLADTADSARGWKESQRALFAFIAQTQGAGDDWDGASDQDPDYCGDGAFSVAGDGDSCNMSTDAHDTSTCSSTPSEVDAEELNDLLLDQSALFVVK